MSAIGTKRTSACALHMSAFDAKRTWAVPYPALFEPLRCLVLSLGGGNETARQNGRQGGKNATPEDVEAPQRRRRLLVVASLPASIQAKGLRCSARELRRGAGAADRDLGGAESHLKLRRANSRLCSNPCWQAPNIFAAQSSASFFSAKEMRFAPWPCTARRPNTLRPDGARHLFGPPLIPALAAYWKPSRWFK